METKASYVAVGAFVLVLMLALAVFVIWLGRVSFEEVSDKYLIYFRGSVTGLQVGSPVRYRGVPVGQVVDIRIDPKDVEQVQVTIEVRHGTPIVVGSIASLEMQGLTGGAYVQIRGGVQGNPPLTAEPGQLYPVIPSEPSTLAAVIETAPQLLQRATRLLDSMNNFLSPRNQQSVTEILENTRMLSRTLAEQSDRIAQTVQRLDGMVANVDGLVTDLRGTTSRVGDQLDRTLGTVDQATVQVTGDLSSAVAEVRGTARSFTAAANQLNGLIRETRGPIRDFTGTGLYELTQTIGELRTLAENLSRLAERLERGGGATLLFNQTDHGRRVE